MGFSLLKSFGRALPVILVVAGIGCTLQSILTHTPNHGVLLTGCNYQGGTVKSGALVEHDIHLVNLSNEAVELFPRPACGCTLVTSPTHPISPLRGFTVHAQVDTAGMHPGFYRKGVTLVMRSGHYTWQAIAEIDFRIAD